MPLSEAVMLPKFAEIEKLVLEARAPFESWGGLRLSGLKNGSFFVLDGEEESHPEMVLSGEADGNFLTIILAKRGSRSSIFFKTALSGDYSHFFAVVLEGESALDLCLVQKGAGSHSRLALAALVGKKASLKLLSSNLGNQDGEAIFSIAQEGEGSRCEHYEATLSTEKNRLLKRSRHAHLSPKTYSRSLFSYVVLEGGSIDVEGSVAIENEAEGADTHLLAKSLLVSKKSFCRLVPRLFVHNHNVTAGHGSAITQPDEEEAFYLSSRGLTELESQQMLVSGFLEEVLKKFGEGSRASELARREIFKEVGLALRGGLDA
ncbi:MAG: SufD family Fe-S cluster assembly protein [Candidatus Micrarchaeota archaeon]|nr:SufD family Fe-S cluster assembly protein [Candidatus Micrarchaeota archaeon]